MESPGIESIEEFNSVRGLSVRGLSVLADSVFPWSDRQDCAAEATGDTGDPVAPELSDFCGGTPVVPAGQGTFFPSMKR